MSANIEILLRNGLIIDPLQNIHSIGSIAVQDGKIAAVGKEVADYDANKVLEMDGRVIIPGLIDAHCHPADGLLSDADTPDNIGLRRGVTTLCDGGSAGAANFHTMRRFVITPSRTSVFCFLNLAETGLVSLPWNDELSNVHDMSISHSIEVIEANRDVIRGLKIRAVQTLVDNLGIKAIEAAKKVASDVGLPIMMHIGSGDRDNCGHKMDDFSRVAVSLMEKGDILSHYLTAEAGGMILKNGTIYPELISAKERGVILDSSHGSKHLSFPITRHALSQGIPPSIISTDFSPPGASIVQSLAVTMSKFLTLGLTIDQIVEMTTLTPARMLREDKHRGSLKPGMLADITILEIKKGDFVFTDSSGGEIIHGDTLLEPIMVMKDGNISPAFSAYHLPPLYKRERAEKK